jgi:DNA-binding response OmpR family regulator
MAHKILVVDDQAYMVRLIQHHLERAGYELIKARNTEEAKDALAKETPELVVMNERAIPSAETPSDLATIPVIRMSEVPATMPDQNLPSETEVVFRKPFSPTKLVAEVKRLIPDAPKPA